MTFWLPLESNPTILNSYIRKLGVSDEWNIVDVFGMDPETLDFVPQPVKSLILLFPCSDAYEQHRKVEDEKLKENAPQYPEDLFFMKQMIHNACGTIALVHAIANNKDIALDGEGILKKYLDVAKSLTPQQRGKLLENDAAFTEKHQHLASKGESKPKPVGVGENNHFIAFIQKDGELYELDGLKSYPIRHGPTSQETFLNDAAKVCKEFMARDPEEVRFTVIAITPTQTKQSCNDC